MQQLVKDYPYDRAAEFEAAREVPRKLAEREYWAKEASRRALFWSDFTKDGREKHALS